MSLTPRPWRTPGFAQVLMFSVLFVALHWVYTQARGGVIERWWIETVTVGTAVALIDRLSPDEQVLAIGESVVSPHARLSVRNGCEGTESLFLLIAAMAVSPLRWWRRVQGALWGAALIVALNELRVVSLYYVFRHHKPLFDPLHAYIAPLAIILIAAVYFMWWLGRGRASP